VITKNHKAPRNAIIPSSTPTPNVGHAEIDHVGPLLRMISPTTPASGNNAQGEAAA
jgi:hypothetical protein